MALKHIYLVRHGETADNRRFVHQSIGVPLTERGLRQAQATALVLAERHTTTLLASDAVRAQETAATIAVATGLTVQTEKTLREFHRGILIEGENHMSLKSLKGSLLIYLHAGDRDWRFGDGENVIEFRARVKAALALFADAPGDHIVAVTHRGLINAIRFCVAHGWDTSPQTFSLAAVLAITKNGSITELTYDPTRKEPWRIAHANTTRHLQGI